MTKVLNRNWCFTVNNYTSDELQFITELSKNLPTSIKTLCFQEEVGALNGTPHLQGVLIYRDAKAICNIKKTLNIERTHCEIMRGSPKQAVDYCIKNDSTTKLDGVRVTAGSIPAGQGRRMDIHSVCEEIDLNNGINSDCISAHGAEFVKYSKGFEYYASKTKRLNADKDFMPYLWQRDILDILKGKPNDREINWVYDPKGNKGKSRLCTHLLLEHKAVVLRGKSSDMAYMYNDNPVVVFDIPRTQFNEDGKYMHAIYEMAECLKNGVIVSTKYESKMKLFTVPHVIVFSNMLPDMNAWSEDRYNIIYLDDYDEKVSAKEHVDIVTMLEDVVIDELHEEHIVHPPSYNTTVTWISWDAIEGRWINNLGNVYNDIYDIPERYLNRDGATTTISPLYRKRYVGNHNTSIENLRLHKKKHSQKYKIV